MFWTDVAVHKTVSGRAVNSRLISSGVQFFVLNLDKIQVRECAVQVRVTPGPNPPRTVILHLSGAFRTGTVVLPSTAYGRTVLYCTEEKVLLYVCTDDSMTLIDCLTTRTVLVLYNKSSYANRLTDCRLTD